MRSVDDCRVVPLRSIGGENGALTPVEGIDEVPFSVARVFYVYDVVGGAVRGGHAHKELQQFIVAIMGSVTILLDDGDSTRSVVLNRPHAGLYVPSTIWADLQDFAGGTVAVVLASLPYDEAEYIRDHDDYLEYRRGLQQA
jgi:dTDP-4-dehydrorhamnose 3,5-epimerase-like enzyme